MSLSVGEQQALNTIEKGLAESYPTLAAKLAMFTRLTADAKMPGHEQVNVREPHVMTPQYRWRQNPAIRLMLWLALAVAVIAASGIGLAVSHGAGRPCMKSFALVCTERPNPGPSGPHGPRPVHDERAIRSMHGLSGRQRGGKN